MLLGISTHTIVKTQLTLAQIFHPPSFLFSLYILQENENEIFFFFLTTEYHFTLCTLFMLRIDFLPNENSFHSAPNAD